MNNNKKIEHAEFIKKYKAKSIYICPKQIKAIGLILSKQAGWYYKPGIIFFSIISVIFSIISVGGIFYLFIDFEESIKVVLMGLGGGFGLMSVTMKVSADLVIKEMIDNKIFFDYIINKKKTEVYISEK